MQGNKAMKNDSENLPGATVKMSATEFELPVDGNNNPEKQLDRENLELDTDSIDRLSVKPVQKYRFIRSIGRGGMKMVLQMKDLDATRDVAMAVLPEATTRPREDLTRFIQEARITASLEHPNIVPVHEIGVDSTGAPYYTMKLLRGKTLAALITDLAEGDEAFRSEYNTIRILRIFLKICSGVAFAHSKGVIHLDLKPENIQVGDFGEVLIMDWGLAKMREHKREVKKKDFETDLPDTGFGSGTLDGIMKGTPGYMAPEQAAGKNSLKDERTDIYSLGAILYSLMTWKDPLEEKTVKERIEATLTGRIIPPSLRAPEREIPAGVEAVIRKAMSLNPAERYQSVKELRNEVNAFIGGYATLAEKASIAKKTVLFFRRHLLLTVMLAIVLFFVLIGAFYMFQTHHRDMTEWKEVFSTASSQGNDLVINAPGNAKTHDQPLANKTEPIQLQPDEWLWLDRAISGNMKLVVTCSAPAEAEIDLVFAAENAPLPGNSSLPAGRCLRLNTNGGWNMIVRVDRSAQDRPAPLAMTKKGSFYGTFSFVLVKEGERIRLYEGNDDSGEPLLDVTDLMPPAGPDLCYIGLRCRNKNLTLRDVKLMQQTVPDSPAPLIRPEILADAGLFQQAFEQYLATAMLYSNENFADEALAKAHLLAATHLAAEPKFRNRVLNRIQKVPAFTRKAEIRISEILYLWNTGNHRQALDSAEKLLTEQPDHPILLQLLAMPRKNVLTEEAQRFLKMLASSTAGKKLVWLDLSGFNLEHLEGIRNMKNLRWLDCSGNHLRDLNALEGMELDFLDCSQKNTLQNIPEVAKNIVR